ncbi:MAG: aminopeptidase N, partial [Pseudomonadales bacterium]
MNDVYILMAASDIAYVHQADYRPPAFRATDAELVFLLDAERTVIRSRLVLERTPEAAADAPLELDGRDFELASLALDGRPLPASFWDRAAERLVVADAGDRCVLEAETVVCPARNRSQMGLFAAGNCLVTQCEADGFRRMTFFPDRPDVMCRFTVRLEADAATYP